MSFFDPGPPLRVKICGVTNPADAEVAVAAGADAVGVNFFPGSRRFAPFEENRAWIASLAGRISRVAVVVNPSAEEVARLRDSGCFEAMQFHGDESPEFCAASGMACWIKAVRVKEAGSLEAALAYATPFLLLDAWSESAYGGTGQRLDWRLAGEFAAARPDRRVILAGGLTPDNVTEAVHTVKLHGVDVAGGVELEPRKKDLDLVRRFIAKAREAWK